MKLIPSTVFGSGKAGVEDGGEGEKRPRARLTPSLTRLSRPRNELRSMEVVTLLFTIVDGSAGTPRKVRGKRHTHISVGA